MQDEVSIGSYQLAYLVQCTQILEFYLRESRISSPRPSTNRVTWNPNFFNCETNVPKMLKKTWKSTPFRGNGIIVKRHYKNEPKRSAIVNWDVRMLAVTIRNYLCRGECVKKVDFEDPSFNRHTDQSLLKMIVDVGQTFWNSSWR